MADGRHQPGGSEKMNAKNKSGVADELYQHKRQGETPDCSEASMMNEGRSIVALVEVDTVDVIEAVVEFFEDEHQRALAVESEDV